MEEKKNYITGISHIGILVPDIEIARRQYDILGFTTHGRLILEESFGIQALVIMNGPYVLELVAPLNESSPLQGSMAQAKQYTMDHICYLVSDLEAQMALMKENRFMVTRSPGISEVWHRRVALLANRKMGVIELMENK